jgi:hypothetical protein
MQLKNEANATAKAVAFSGSFLHENLRIMALISP